MAAERAGTGPASAQCSGSSSWRRTSPWVHVHLAAAYPSEPWIEHFDWPHPLFPERLEIRDGRMRLSDRPGLGITVSDQARAWTTDTAATTG